MIGMIIMLSLLRSLFFLVLLATSCMHAQPLRVKPIFKFLFKSSWQDFKTIMMPLLEKHDITFVDQDPDLILICGTRESAWAEIQTPHIILDEGESASLSKNLRSALNNPHLKAIFKNTTLTPKSLYNVSQDYHFHLLTRCRQPASPLSDDKLAKIQTVLWDLPRSAANKDFSTLIDNDIDFNASRLIDASFAGTILFIGKESTHGKNLHRKDLIQKLETIKNYKIISYVGRLPKDDYVDLLKHSKIVISPWGAGEWCWRDYEAIYSGAVLIKPDTDFVHAAPNLYQTNTFYVACKADFSDLQDKIAHVVNNYEKFTDMRKRARDLLINHYNYERIAQDLAQAIKNIASSSNLPR